MKFPNAPSAATSRASPFPACPSKAKLQALRLGARIVPGWADNARASAAASALGRIEIVLPPKPRQVANRQFLFAPGFAVTRESKAWMRELRRHARPAQSLDHLPQSRR